MNRPVRTLFLLTGLSLLSACGTIKNIFPDKEKDYRFTRELPDLVVPNDLGQRNESQVVRRSKPEVEETLKAIPKTSARPTEQTVSEIVLPISKPTAAPIVKPSEPIPATAPQVNAVAPDTNSVLQTTPLQEEPIKVSKYAEGVADVDDLVAPQITLKKTSERTAILQINQSLDRTWRIVGKALTEQALEITERNTKSHYYVVLYDPKAKALKDDSILDDIGFMFGIENNQEEPYRIALDERDKQTDVQVLDENGKTCSSDACVQLTKLLRTALEKSLKD